MKSFIFSDFLQKFFDYKTHTVKKVKLKDIIANLGSIDLIVSEVLVEEHKPFEFKGGDTIEIRSGNYVIHAMAVNEIKLEQ